MATRGQIAYLSNPNSIFTTYIHYDAYPEHLGKILPKFFNSNDQAQELVMDGPDIRSIDDDGTVERFNKGGSKLIKGETPEELFSNLYEHSDRSTADYVYVWLEDKWVTLNVNEGREYFVGTLLNQIRKIEPTMENKNKIKEGYFAANNEVEELIDTLGYETLDEFFNDNPGVVTVILDWAAGVPEFKRKMIDNGLLEAKKEELDENFINKMKYRAGIIK